uniref:C2H2-type domain-containing protein n=1 Tax=Ditylenchus dipsaci TaxID=166011 RepID=A0A915EUF0_9BILA
MEQVEFINENNVGVKEQQQTLSDTHRMKALMCPEPGCQTFFSSIKSFCSHVAAEHKKQLIEFNAVFPTVEDYQVWLDSLKKTNSGEFSTQRPAQAHPDGSMTGTLYCSQMEKNKNTATSTNFATNNFDRGCAAHVNFEVKADRSVVVHAQLAHCGHEVSQIALSALGSRKEVAVKFDELLALYTSVHEKLDTTMVSASLNWFEIPKMEVVMRMVEEAASNMYYARGIVDEIQSFYNKNPDSRNNPFTTVNQTRSSFVPSIRFQVGEKKRGRPTNASNAHKIAKKGRVSLDSGEVSLQDARYQPLLIQEERERTENDGNAPAVDQIIHPAFLASVSDETTQKVDSLQQDLPATRLSDGRVKCPRCTRILKNVASYKGHMRSVHHVLLKANRSSIQSLVAQQQQNGEQLQPSSAVQLYSRPPVEAADHTRGEAAEHLHGEAVGVVAVGLTAEQVPKNEEIPLDNV